MSEHSISLLTSNNTELHDELIDDKKAQSCCFKVFRCCNKRRTTKNKGKTNSETYELKEKSLLENDEITDSNYSSNHANELKDQTKLIESPINDNTENPISERLHAGDNSSGKANVNNKLSIECHANESENKLGKPQDNSLKSFKDNNGNINVEIPYAVCKHDEVVNTSCENNLSGKTLSLQSSSDVEENKQLLQSSSRENTVYNPNSQVTVHVDDCDVPTQVKDSQALLNDSLELEGKNKCSASLFLSSGPEEHFESSDCEPDERKSGEENIILDSILATETRESVLSVRSSTTSEVIEYNFLENIGVDINFEDGNLECADKQIVRNTSCQAGGKKSFCENIVDFGDTDNALKTISEDVSENKLAVVKKESSPNSVDVKLQKSDIGVIVADENIENQPPSETTVEDSYELNFIETSKGEVDINTDLRISPEGSEGSRSINENTADLKEETEVFGAAEVEGVKRREMTNYYSLVSDPLLYTQGDLDEVVKAREDEWQQRQDELERKVKEEIAMRELLEEDHRTKMDCLRKDNSDMKTVVSQYEKTIVELTEHSRNIPVIDEDTLSETVRAKDQLHQDLNTAETNLVDAYKRIEKLKLAVDSYKQNEDSLKGSLKEYQTKLQKSEERYNKLKQHASEKIDAANIEIERVRKQKEIDLAGLHAALKKAQNRVANLEVEIAQKSHENKELSQICDELIKKVSGE